LKIAIGCDHRGFKQKQYVTKLLEDSGHGYEDFGCFSGDPIDYPDIAEKVARAVAEGKAERGILICSTGIGMCIAANKIAGSRAALCYDNFCTLRARQHNDANILCLGESLSHGEVADMVGTFLGTTFEGGRHQRRLDKIKALEE
jgi:ribose 5-phosphate isomerase B